jgi:hypothetical protein
MLKSFRAFLESDAGQQAIDSDFISRFLAANVRVETRSQLGQFAKQRWPQDNPSDYRQSTGGPRSREAMSDLWSKYLAWFEAPAVDKKAATSEA